MTIWKGRHAWTLPWDSLWGIGCSLAILYSIYLAGYPQGGQGFSQAGEAVSGSRGCIGRILARSQKKSEA